MIIEYPQLSKFMLYLLRLTEEMKCKLMKKLAYHFDHKNIQTRAKLIQCIYTNLTSWDDICYNTVNENNNKNYDHNIDSL